MKKILVIYAAHFINDFSLSQYYKLKNELPEGYDIVWWLDDNYDGNLIDGIEFIRFPHHTIKSVFKYWFNPMKYMETYYTKNESFRNYDYYWIVEYDVYFNGNWKYFFETVDKYDEDLVCSALTMYKCDSYIEFFGEKSFYDYFDKIFKSYISIYRISNKALKTIIDYNDCDIKKYLYEVYIPTILYKKGLSFLSLNKERYIISDNHLYDYSIDFQNYYDDTCFIDDAVNDFWYDKIFTHKSQMNKQNKLYTRYKK